MKFPISEMSSAHFISDMRCSIVIKLIQHALENLTFDFDNTTVLDKQPNLNWKKWYKRNDKQLHVYFTITTFSLLWFYYTAQ